MKLRRNDYIALCHKYDIWLKLFSQAKLLHELALESREEVQGALCTGMQYIYKNLREDLLYFTFNLYDIEYKSCESVKDVYTRNKCNFDEDLCSSIEAILAIHQLSKNLNEISGNFGNIEHYFNNVFVPKSDQYGNYFSNPERCITI